MFAVAHCVLLITPCVSSLVGTSFYNSGGHVRSSDSAHIYKQKHARSDGNVFQAIDAPNDGIAYDPSLATSSSTQKLSSSLRSVSGGIQHVSRALCIFWLFSQLGQVF
jgi:hypothetical protein